MVQPARPFPKVADPAAQSPGVESGARSPAVLIVDDDPTARLALAAMLAPDDYRIAFATDAADVRSRLARIDPDVILCDLVMQKMCGDELIRWLQSHERWNLVPILVVTRIDSTVVRADLLLAGADTVLVKPCNGPELRAQVKAALRTRRKYRLLAAQQTQAAGSGPTS
jgi:two-component system response regulator PrrA